MSLWQGSHGRDEAKWQAGRSRVAGDEERAVLSRRRLGQFHAAIDIGERHSHRHRREGELTIRRVKSRQHPRLVGLADEPLHTNAVLADQDVLADRRQLLELRELGPPVVTLGCLRENLDDDLRVEESINALHRLDDECVVTNTGRGPVTGFSIAKEKVDAIMRAKLGRPLLAWVWHDLRKTVVTMMSDNGVAPHIVEATVNHISGSKGGIAGVYNKAAYASDRKAALDSWGRYLDGVIGRGGDNVVTLRA